MGDKNRPRSKTARSPSSNSIRQRSVSKAETPPEPEQEPEAVENTISWDIASKDQLTELLACAPPDILSKLCGILKTPNTHINLKNSIKADLYLLAVHFSQQQKLDEVETGGLLTLLHHLLAMVVEEKELLDFVIEASQLLTGMNEFRKGMKFDFYTPEKVTAIMEYLQTTLFQHYKLYKFSLLREQEETIISLDKTVSTCPPLGSFDPPPLAEAISDHDVDTYLNAAPPASEPEEGSQGEGSQGEGTSLEEQAGEVLSGVETSPNPLISLGNVQEVMDTVGADMLEKFSKDIKAKVVEKENQFIGRLNKVKKTLD